jgi:hypothetical protein
MGCDIHAFIEFKEESGIFASLTNGTLALPREFPLFNHLAFGDGGCSEELPYPPRGLPADLSSATRSYFYAPADKVRDRVHVHLSLIANVTGKPVEALMEVYLSGVSPAAKEEYRCRQLLPEPELHTHSWLTFGELEEVLAWARMRRDDLSPEFAATVGAMQVLAVRFGDKDQVRLVFGFDG